MNKKFFIFPVIFILLMFAAGCSEPDDDDRLPDPPGRPDAPEANVPEGEFSAIHIGWDTASDADRYGIFRIIDDRDPDTAEEDDDYNLIGMIENMGNEYIVFEDRKAIVDTWYKYKIRAYNIGGSSNFSNESGPTQLQTVPINFISFIYKDTFISSGLYDPESVKFFNNRLYISDTNNHRIIEISETYTQWLGWDTSNTPGWHEMSIIDYNDGNGNGQFFAPHDLFIHNSGIMYIADTNNNRIQKILPGGEFSASFGSAGTGDGEFDRPCSVALDSEGNIYVADTNNDRVQKISKNGDFIELYGGAGSSALGDFNNPTQLFIHNDILYVTDTSNNRIQKYEDGTWYALSANGSKWHQTAGNTSGTGDGAFNAPESVTVDNNGYLYIADNGNQRIQVFFPDGSLVGWFGYDGTGTDSHWFQAGSGKTAVAGGTLDDPAYADMGINNYLYVCESDFDNIKRLLRIITP